MSQLQALRVGLLGFGVVGSGTWNVLKRNSNEIARRAGRRIEIVRIATRTISKATDIVGDAVPVTANLMDVVDDPSIDIVVELIGGTTLAKEVVIRALNNGKHVVTANKALLAHHGNEIFKIASDHKVMVAFEAAVAGGIPIIKSVREGLTANRIQSLAGIINGTSNFILSEMRSKALTFDVVLKDAQKLGYAEADPTFDIEGVDVAHKLTILASTAFGIPIQFDRVYSEGITKIEQEDVVQAERLGYRLKLLGIATRRDEGIELRVHPTLIPATKMLANVEGAMNAVMVRGDAVGETLFYGPGAGSEPTASAVVADLVDVTRLHTADPEHRVPHLAFQADALEDYRILPIDEARTGYYLRMTVRDQKGVLADVSRIFANHEISINSMIQDNKGNNLASLIFLIHQTIESSMQKAIKEIEALDSVQSDIKLIRLENLC
ncbi:homoserine dehydrogenase [Taylorella equigenitalis]|uniref:Homoserine dehydrogenase n=3 Tax=Taylorella equigenitalis TaxID=29575 RepID=A0A654KIJ8_TAYEM|nr:homoserine dehydrogenase [Taylorella equigenitalis]ADU92242.1 Homoserine dehydrogenase [Taylorella equigenitalis MCE9]AFN35796.1 homoserine dehydrogenase [Taylorella equigenitalis ATCC 35865]ASY30436.1 homoserine dehydrogenase [Taylorella equigenitalis]ASY37743.1 homoserine dehydrogenase [Taylorella equigenitalis]ASY39211.1 homoserine dehydrogenase [Taylorella equigenitalis]